MKKKWLKAGISPAGGTIYHKDDRIMILYRKCVRIFCNISKDKEFIPSSAEYYIERKFRK